MNITDTPRECILKLLLIFTIATFLTGLFDPCISSAETKPKTDPSELATEKLKPEELKVRQDWQKAMAQVPLPKKGCFQSTYPNREWKEVPCIKAPLIPMPPRRGARPAVVGNGDDISAQAPTGFISTATGTFDSVTGVTSVTSPIGNAGAAVANAYTLQLNTDFFASTACAGSPNPGCQGWEQFVFFNDGNSGSVFIQYWLLRFNAACPAGGWNQFSFTGSTDIYCFRNSNNAVATANQPITNMAQFNLTGAVTATGDTIAFANATNMFTTTGNNSVNAAAGWRTAEFNVFGAGGNSSGGGEATFNAGSTVVPRTRIIYGGTTAPTCVAQGFTGETNNLSFGPNPPASSAPGPAVSFTESIAGGATSNCAAATSVGDTHLATFNGLFYDFQASGDFVLAEVDPDFVVQARQVSGAPSWPNASVNSAVATRIGKSKIAICLGPKLNIDGRNMDLSDGKSIALDDNTAIRRTGNVYMIVGEAGDSVRVEVNSAWINVSVGLGHWPSKVRGLIVNANGNVNQIAARDGVVLTNPFPFEELYHHYADSWRVPADKSLLSACGGREAEHGSPKKPFFAKDLEPQIADRARKICIGAGVKEGPLLDACTLDVVVIGDKAAAQIFVRERAPKAVGKVRVEDYKQKK